MSSIATICMTKTVFQFLKIRWKHFNLCCSFPLYQIHSLKQSRCPILGYASTNLKRYISIMANDHPLTVPITVSVFTTLPLLHAACINNFTSVLSSSPSKISLSYCFCGNSEIYTGLCIRLNWLSSFLQF